MEGREKVYFTTEETTIYPKSLVIYLKSSYYLDEVWLTLLHVEDEDYRSAVYFMNF